jgi:hypothetical protein
MEQGIAHRPEETARAEARLVHSSSPRNRTIKARPCNLYSAHYEWGFTRNGYDWTERYPAIVEAALRNRSSSFVIDGEAVLVGVDGVSDFNGLDHDDEVQLYAFDVPALDGIFIAPSTYNEGLRRLNEQCAYDGDQACCGREEDKGASAQILIDLDRVSGPERSLLLEGFESLSSDYSLLVNPPWTEEQRRNELNAADAAERYKRMALLIQKWRMRALAIQCYVARAVMFDEYIKDEKGAQAALDEAVAALGEDVVISRARARVFWRHNKYHDAVRILRGIADVVGRDSPIDRAFAMREAAISAAKTDDWAQAVAWFGEAEKAAAASGTSDMQTMAVGLEADRAVAFLESGNVEGALQTMVSCLTRLSKINPDESLRAAYCHRVVRHTVLWMDSEIDKRETLINGKPIEMLPGTCSNPEPPASITELPLGPLDLAWYMLAEAETSSGRDVGIVKSLRAQLKDGPILFMEVMLRNRRIMINVRNSDAVGFSQHLLDFLAGMEYLRRQQQTARDTFSALAPPRGEVPPLSGAELADPVVAGLAVDALIAFDMASALRGTPDPIIEIQKSLTDIVGEDYPCKSIVDNWRRADVPLAPLDKAVNEAIAILRSDRYLTPRRLWEVGLRLYEKIRQSNFRQLLAPLLASWLRERWKRIIANETFRLSRPMQTVPAIEASLAETTKSEAFIASLLLATAEAVGSPLGTEYEELLREVAKGAG